MKKRECLIYRMLALALERIESCVCWNDTERDGCYRCLYGYRNAKEMDDTSATVAADMIRKILASEDKLTPVDSLSQISIAGLTDSH